MKTLPILSSFLVLGALVAQAQPAAPARSTAQVTLRATDKVVRPEKDKKKDDAESDDDKKDDKPKSETVTKSLDVDISAAKTINGPLKIVICWYSRDVTSKQQTMAKKQESKVDLDAAKNAKLTQTFACTFTPAHTKKTGDKKSIKVDATGKTHTGWTIRAYEGETLVGETASSPHVSQAAGGIVKKCRVICDQ